MYVLKNIGPLKTKGITHRFKIGMKISEAVLHLWGKDAILQLQKAKIIGDKSNEPVRQSKTGQQKNTKSRVVSTDNDNKHSSGNADNSGSLGSNKSNV